MFSNKKSILPPRPHIPDPEHILEDLSHANIHDIAFKIINKDEMQIEDTYISTNFNNSEDIYEKIKMYLNVKQQLNHLKINLIKEQEDSQRAIEEIKNLANDIRKQAQAALVM